MRRNLWYSVVAFGLLTSPCLLAQGASRVRAEQQALKDKGFDPGPVDGRDGPKTRAALREFQAKQNLKQDGRLGPQTRDALGLRPGSARTDMKEAGANVKTGYSEGGKDVGHGAKEMAHDVAKGHPVEAGKDLGKGLGHGVAKMGEGTGHAVKNAAKSVKNAVTGDNKDTTNK